jgi:hypothetical protein
MLRDTSSEEQVRQSLQHILMGQVPGHVNSQAFTSVFIKNGQHPEAPAIPGSSMNEVIAPHMIPMFRAKPDAGTVVQP